MTETLKAGPPLDARIAKMMEPMPSGCPVGGLSGPVISDGGWWVWCGTGWRPKKHPSTDIATAWEVLEKLKELPGKVGVVIQQTTSGYTVSAHSIHGFTTPYVSKSAPLAICLAAAEAVKEQEG